MNFLIHRRKAQLFIFLAVVQIIFPWCSSVHDHSIHSFTHAFQNAIVITQRKSIPTRHQQCNHQGRCPIFSMHSSRGSRDDSMSESNFKPPRRPRLTTLSKASWNGNKNTRFSKQPPASTNTAAEKRRNIVDDNDNSILSSSSTNSIRSSRTSFHSEPSTHPSQHHDNPNNKEDISIASLANAIIGCDHFETCPGCVVMDHVAQVDVIQSAKLYFDSLIRQKLLMTAHDHNNKHNNQNNNNHRGGFHVVVPTKSVRQWRTQAKLVVASSSSKNPWLKTTVSNEKGCIFGLYQRNSHNVISIPNCQVHHPSINQAVQALEIVTAKVQTPACIEEGSTTGPNRHHHHHPTTTTNTLPKLRSGLRYVQLQVERTTGKIGLTLVWFARDVKHTQPALSHLTKELVKAYPDLWHSIWLHCHDGLGNNIFSRSPTASSWHLLHGPEFMREPLSSWIRYDSNNNHVPFQDNNNNNHQYPRYLTKSSEMIMTTTAATAEQQNDHGTHNNGPWLYFTPQTFRQANMDGFEKLALYVAELVPPGSKVCELYAGVGVLGITTLLYHANQNTPLTWLRCSDENPHNTRCFRRAVNSLPALVSGRDENSRKRFRRGSSEDGESLTLAQLAEYIKNPESISKRKKRNLLEQSQQREKTSYLVASAGSALLSGQALGANVLIVDPPRKGLDEEVLVELCKPVNPDQDDSVESIAQLLVPDDKVNWLNSVKTLIYVSCGFEALTRDCDRIFSNRASGWKMQSATGYVLFPGSDHVETVCLFQRR